MGKSASSILYERSKKSNIPVSKGDAVKPRKRLLTGIAAADYALNGGIPMGGITHCYGQESSGKTNFSLKTIASCQKMYPDRVNVFVDLERSYSNPWAKKMGVDTSKLEVVYPEYAEQAIDMIVEIAGADDLGVMVVDSVAAFMTVNEDESSVEKMNVGGNSMLIGNMCKKLVNALAPHKHEDTPGAVILLNQMRHKIGAIHSSPENPQGGWALKHYAFLTLRFGASKSMNSKIHPTVQSIAEVRVGIKKNKIPINDQQFSFEQFLVDAVDGSVQAGQIFNAKSVLSRLKQHGLLVKDGQNWKVEGADIVVKTQKELQNQIEEDVELYSQMMGLLGVDVTGTGEQ